MSEILKSIAKIMGEVGSVAKAGTNDFHRYKYATAADILHKLQPLMAREGLIVFQAEKTRDFLADGAVLSVTYEFTLAHKSGEVWPTTIERTGMAAARNSKGGFDDKALNKCHTSAHKYFHLTLFEIPTGDYDDADADEDHPPVKGNGKPAEQPRATVTSGQRQAPPEPTEAERKTATVMVDTIRMAETEADLADWLTDNKTVLESLPDSLRDQVRQAYRRTLAALRDKMPEAAE
jgi:hypothetical protein